MTTLHHYTITQARKGLQEKQFSAVELTQSYLTQMEAHSSLNAYITATPELALAQAKAADEALAAGTAGALAGIPLGIKDLFCTKGVHTTAGSKILEGFVPEYESTVTQKLFDAGGVMLGKLNLDEFAMGSANITSHYGPAINPWKRTNDTTDLVPGGSSGGSSAAVAGFLCAGATGTDTGGSIRQPAAFTGIVGIKPTYGRCSRWGTVAFASSLDQAGAMTRSVEDAALMLEVMSGFDAKDSTSAQKEVPAFAANLQPDIRGKKIGIPKEYRENLPAELQALWEKGAHMLKAQGAEIVDISLPHTKYALPAYYIIAPAEASSNLARYDGVRYGYRTSQPFHSLDEMYALTRHEGFGEEVQRRILIGTYVLSHGYYDAYYKKAQRIRTLIARDFKAAFEQVDAILTPTTPSAAFGLSENQDDPVQMYLNDLFTVPASLAGIPGMSVPVAQNADALPLGLQILGNYFDEQTVLNVGAALEKAAGFTATPKGY